jgi:hypothetical protein
MVSRLAEKTMLASDYRSGSHLKKILERSLHNEVPKQQAICAG